MGNSNIPVIKFLFRSSWHALAEAIHLQPSLDVKVCSLANDVSNHLINAPAVLIMASIREKNDLIQLATLMKISRSWSKELSCKIVVINFTNDQQFEKAITKLGVQDVIDAGINTKALKFKMDFWMKSLQAQVRGSVIASQAPKNLKNNEINKLSETKTANTVPNWSSSLATDNDIWIVKNEGDCKKILSKWLVKLKGPSPYVGQWTEVGPDTWRFDLKDLERKEFTPGKGHWFYKGGNKPDFYWSENTWLFAGENFDLFYKDADQHHSRISCRNRIFTICENSKFAENKTKLIAESCDKDLVYRKEADVLANLEGQVKGGADHLKNLEGKTKTDRLKDGPLSGSTKGTDSLGNGLLSQKTETAHEVTHWQGKNSYQQTDVSDFAGPSGQKIAKGKTLELEDGNHEHQKYYKNHNPSEEFKAKQGDLKSPSGKVDAIDGYMGGKQKTGADRSNNLSGTSSAERPDAKTKNQDTSSGKVDHLAGHLSGKQKTGADRSNNLSGTSSAERPEAKTKDQDSSGGKVDHLAGHLGGKQKTGAERSNNLSGTSSAERPEAKTKDQDSFGGKVDHLAGHLSGKQKTGADRSNNLSSTSSAERPEAKTKDQDSSGGKVDHLAGHLGGKQKTGADRSNNLSGTSSAERPEAKTKDQDSSGGKVDHLAGHLSGKQKTEAGRSNDLAGKTSAERPEAKTKDQDSSGGMVDHLAGHLSGKQKTGADRSNNLSGTSSPEKSEAKTKDQDSSGGKVDHLAGHLSGKQKTGADRSNNLSGTSSAERPEAKTKDQDSSGGKVDHLAGHLSGKQKSGSDRSNDLSGRISPERTEANKAKDEDSPSGKVDHFAGHLNGKQKSGADRSNNLAGKTSAESAESNLEPRELKSSLASDEKKKQEKFSFEYNKKGEKKKDVPKGDASRAEESSLPSETSPEIESKEFPKEKNSESKQAERGAKTLSSEDDQQWAGLVGDSLTTPPARQQRPDQEPAGVLSLEKARQDRIKKILLSDPETSELDELDELAASAKVTAYLKQGRLNLLCELDDFFDETLIFISPKSLKTESEVNLVLHFDYFNKIETLDMVGTITVQEDSDNGQSYVTVKLKNKNVEKFESFMKLYKTRQANVNSFLKSVKGF